MVFYLFDDDDSSLSSSTSCYSLKRCTFIHKLFISVWVLEQIVNREKGEEQVYIEEKENNYLLERN